MEIVNLDSNLFPLSLSNMDTLKHWGKILQVAFNQRKRSNLVFEEIVLSKGGKAFESLDSMFPAFGRFQDEANIPMLLSKPFVDLLIQEVHDINVPEQLDEFELSIASVGMNELMSDIGSLIRVNIESQSAQKHVPLQDHKMMTLELKLRHRLETMSILVYLKPEIFYHFLKEFAHAHTKNLDLLLNVPFSVKVELGSVRKRVKEIMEFTSGTIIELDQSIHSLAEVIVNDQLIARGEVVEVSGNYGVVIQEVFSNGPLSE